MGIRWAHMGNWYGIRGPICHPFGAIHLNGPNWYRPKVDHLLDIRARTGQDPVQDYTGQDFYRIYPAKILSCIILNPESCPESGEFYTGLFRIIDFGINGTKLQKF